MLRILRLPLQVVVDGLGAGRRLVGGARGAGGAGLVPGDGQRHDLRQFVQEKPLLVPRLVQRELDRRGAQGLRRDDVVGVVARHVAAVVVLVRRDEVLPEHDVASRHGRPVRPPVILQVNGHDLAVGGPDRRFGEGTALVEHDLGAVAHPVEGPEQEVRELVEVHVRVLGGAEEREDVRRRRARREGEGDGRPAHRAGRARAAAAGARRAGGQQGPGHHEHGGHPGSVHHSHHTRTTHRFVSSPST